MLCIQILSYLMYFLEYIPRELSNSNEVVALEIIEEDIFKARDIIEEIWYMLYI